MSSQDPNANAIDDLVSQLIKNPNNLPSNRPSQSNPSRPVSQPNPPIPPAPFKPSPPPTPPRNMPPQNTQPSKPSPVSPASPPQNLPGMTVTPPNDKTQQYQSSVRTMQSDIEAIKRSQSLGVPFTPKSVPLPPPELKNEKPSAPKLEVPVPPKLPDISKLSEKPIRPEPFTSQRPPIIPNLPPIKEEVKPEPSSGPGLSFPKFSGLSRTWLIIGVVVLVLAGGGLAYLYLWPSSEPIPSPTPTASATPRLSVFEIKFGAPSSVIVPSTDLNFVETTKLGMSKDIAPGQFKAYRVLDENQARYGLGTFLGKLGAAPMVSASDYFKTSDWALVAYGHYDQAGGSINRPFIVVKITDPTKVQELMSAWESNNLIRDMAGLFQYEQDASAVMTNDTYNNVSFRFARLKTRDSGISYAVLKDILIIASSRDSFRAAVDALSSPSTDK